MQWPSIVDNMFYTNILLHVIVASRLGWITDCLTLITHYTLYPGLYQRVRITATACTLPDSLSGQEASRIKITKQYKPLPPSCAPSSFHASHSDDMTLQAGNVFLVE